MNKSSEATAIQHLLEHRDAEIPTFVYWVFIGSVISFPLSIMRIAVTGWIYIYGIQLLVFLVIIGLFIYRRSIAPKTQALVLVAMNLIIAIMGIMIFGIVGSGTISALSCIMICLFFVSFKATLVVCGILSATYTLSMYYFVNGIHMLPVDSDIYITAKSSWGTVMFGSVVFVILTISGIFRQQKLSLNLIAELEDRNRTIEAQKKSLEHLANHDPLTGLATLRVGRQQLELAISKANTYKHQIALFFLDLDGFKAINDQYGHMAGDEALKVTAARIISMIRDNDTACRIGGDEFIIIIDKVDTPELIQKLCERLIESINRPIVYNSQTLTVGTSIGVVTYPGTGTDPSNLLRIADELMYQVKAEGKNSYRMV